jgi:hypothetical protein
MESNGSVNLEGQVVLEQILDDQSACWQRVSARAQKSTSSGSPLCATIPAPRSM